MSRFIIYISISIILTAVLIFNARHIGFAMLSPESQSVIQGTTIIADDNESPEILEAVKEAQHMISSVVGIIRLGTHEEQSHIDIDEVLEKANVLMDKAISQNPDSRNAWQTFGHAHWFKYEWSHLKKDVLSAIQAYTRSVELMLDSESVEYHNLMLVDRIAGGLSLLGDRAALDDLFVKLKKANHPDDIWSLVIIDYAKALGKMKDERADEVFEEALKIANTRAALPYAEYLHDMKSYQESLDILDKYPPPDYEVTANVLRGVLMERLGRFEEARKEYGKYKEKQVKSDYSYWPVPEKYRIEGSKIQEGIGFGKPPYEEFPEPKNDQSNWLQKIECITPAYAEQRSTTGICSASDWHCRAKYYIVWTINGEAGSLGYASIGMQRAVAWNIRTRVFWGRTGIQCDSAFQTCTNYAPPYKYSNTEMWKTWRRYFYVVDTGSYQGLLIGKYTNDALSVYDNVNKQGSVPDPIAGACLKGAMIGDSCSGICSENAGILGSFRAHESGIEFRAGKIQWTCGQYVGCCYQELVSMTLGRPKRGKIA